MPECAAAVRGVQLLRGGEEGGGGVVCVCVPEAKMVVGVLPQMRAVPPCGAQMQRAELKGLTGERHIKGAGGAALPPWKSSCLRVFMCNFHFSVCDVQSISIRFLCACACVPVQAAPQH